MDVTNAEQVRASLLSEISTNQRILSRPELPRKLEHVQ